MFRPVFWNWGGRLASAYTEARTLTSLLGLSAYYFLVSVNMKEKHWMWHYLVIPLLFLKKLIICLRCFVNHMISNNLYPAILAQNTFNRLQSALFRIKLVFNSEQDTFMRCCELNSVLWWPFFLYFCFLDAICCDNYIWYRCHTEPRLQISLLGKMGHALLYSYYDGAVHQLLH